MARVPYIHCLDARRSVTVPDPAAPGGSRRVVFQLTGYGLGNIPGDPRRRLQIRAHVIPYDPHTLAQQSRRLHMANANVAWHALTTEEQQAYEPEAKKKRLTAHNIFVRAWLLTPPPVIAAQPFPYGVPYALGIVLPLGTRHAPQLPTTEQ